MALNALDLLKRVHYLIPKEGVLDSNYETGFDLNKYIAKFKNDISEVIENDEISEVWLNTKLSLFDNKSPLEASKYKKYKKKIFLP